MPLVIIACFSFFAYSILASSTLDTAPVWRRLLLPLGITVLLLPFWIAAVYDPNRRTARNKEYRKLAKSPRRTNYSDYRTRTLVRLATIVVIGLTCCVLFAGRWVLGGSVFAFFLFLGAIWTLRQ